MARVPKRLWWLFWEVEPARLDTSRDEASILPRVLEFGGMAEVRWAVATYGLPRIHAFLRDVGHPELSARTLTFWRAVLRAGGERWASTPAWRKSRIAPWVG